MKATVVAMGLQDVLGKLKEAQAQAARHAEQQKANEAKLRAAGYTDDGVCLVNACLQVIANPDVDGLSRIGHLAKMHDILEAAQAFAAHYHFVEKALRHIRHAEGAAGVHLLESDCDGVVHRNAEEAYRILANLETKYANLRAIEADA